MSGNAADPVALVNASLRCLGRPRAPLRPLLGGRDAVTVLAIKVAFRHQRFDLRLGEPEFDWAHTPAPACARRARIVLSDELLDRARRMANWGEGRAQKFADWLTELGLPEYARAASVGGVPRVIQD